MKKWNQLARLGKEYSVSEIQEITNAYELSTDLALEKSNLFESLTAYDVFVVWLATQYNTRTVNDKLSKGDNDLNLFDRLLHRHFEEALVKFPRCEKEYVYRKDTIGCNTKISSVLTWWRRIQGKVVEIPWFLAVSDELWDDHSVNWEIELINPTNAYKVAELSSIPKVESESIFLKGSKFIVKNVIEPEKDQLLVKLKEVDSGIVPDSVLYSNSYILLSKEAEEKLNMGAEEEEYQ